MADNHFQRTAERLREINKIGNLLFTDQQAHLEEAAKTLCRLEQFKRDLLASHYSDEVEGDRLAAELMALLGIHPSEHPKRI